jgi:hypothetical protein
MPKQFLKIFGSSLFQRTLQGTNFFKARRDIRCKEYRFRVMDDLEEIGTKLKQKVFRVLRSACCGGLYHCPSRGLHRYPTALFQAL